MNIHVLYALEHKTSKKKISVCLYVRMYVPTYVDSWLQTQ